MTIPPPFPAFRLPLARAPFHLAAFLLLLAWAGTAGAQEERISFVSTMGEAFENAKIIRVEPDGIALSHSRGITKVPLEQLPEEVRARFNLDGANAARYRARQAEAARYRAEEDRILRERRLQEEQQAADAKELASKIHADYAWHANGVCFTGRVLFVDQGDVLFQLKNKPGTPGIVGYPLYWLPPSERERVRWIFSQLSPQEREAGEIALYEHERMYARKRARQKEEELRARRKGE